MTPLRTLDQIRTDRVHATNTRRLLANIHRWARTNGWEPAHTCWRNRERRILVAWADEQVSVWTGNDTWPVTHTVLTVQQAVDVLCAVGVLPAEFSSAYAAGRRAA